MRQRHPTAAQEAAVAWKRRPGHGRQGAETYRGAEHVVCHHEELGGRRALPGVWARALVSGRARS